MKVTLKIAYNNSFQTVARGKWEANGTRLRVAVTYGVSPFVKIFMGVWLGLCGIFCLILPIPLLLGTQIMTSGRHGTQVPAGPWAAWVMAFAPVGMMLFGAGLYKFGRYLARNEEATLRTAIEGALRGRR